MERMGGKKWRLEERKGNNGARFTMESLVKKENGDMMKVEAL